MSKGITKKWCNGLYARYMKTKTPTKLKLQSNYINKDLNQQERKWKIKDTKHHSIYVR